MKLTRRDLFKTAGAAGAATAVGGAAVVGSGLAAEAVAGTTGTTLDKTFLISKPDAKGWSRSSAGRASPTSSAPASARRRRPVAPAGVRRCWRSRS